jgi:hypothetical protein
MEETGYGQTMWEYGRGYTNIVPPSKLVRIGRSSEIERMSWKTGYRKLRLPDMVRQGS